MGIVQATEKSNIEKFFALHYPEADFNGSIHLWAKRHNSNNMYRVWYGLPGEISGKLSRDNISSRKKDYYITANTVCSGARRSDSLFSLNNIVIDLDNHSNDLSGIDFQFEAIKDIYRDLFNLYGYYIPNSIVKTGRGFQLWFAVEQISYKLREVWTELTEEILKQTEQILKDYPVLGGLSVDTGASKNASGLFRLPISFNSKSRTRADFEILHDVPLDALQEVRAIRSSREAKVVKFRPVVESSGYKQAEFRESAIIRLIKSRQDKGQIIERDNFLFCIFCIWGNVIQDDEEILYKVLQANKLFETPFTEREIRSALYTAFKKRYRLRNESIVDRLNITPEEQTDIGLLSGGREYQRRQARERKIERDKKILNLYKSGATQEEIARDLNISRRTVCNVLMRQNARKSDLKRARDKDIRDRYKRALKGQIRAFKTNNKPLEKGGLLSMPKCEKSALYSVVILDAPGQDRGDQVAPGGSDRDSFGGAPGEICSEGGVGGDSTSRFSDGLRDNSTSEDSKNAHRGTDFP